MTLDEAVKILNERRHRGCEVWHRDSAHQDGDVVGRHDIEIVEGRFEAGESAASDLDRLNARCPKFIAPAGWDEWLSRPVPAFGGLVPRKIIASGEGWRIDETLDRPENGDVS